MLVAHKPLQDQLIEQESLKLLHNIQLYDTDLATWSSDLYTNQFRRWLLSSESNKILGLEQYANSAYCVGSTDGIQSFILRHIRNRRIRCSRQEFTLTKIVVAAGGGNLVYLEDAPIDTNDAVVISYPFAGNGSEIPNYNNLLQDCTNLSVPVCLDATYFSISQGLTFDFTYPCITDVVTSLSKSFVTQLRLGVRFTRHYIDDQIQVCNNIGYYNRISAFIGLQLMEKFSHDYIVSKYKSWQQFICIKYNLDPTPTLTLAIGNPIQHPEFVRENICRICITDELRRLI